MYNVAHSKIKPVLFHHPFSIRENGIHSLHNMCGLLAFSLGRKIGFLPQFGNYSVCPVGGRVSKEKEKKRRKEKTLLDKPECFLN